MLSLKDFSLIRKFGKKGQGPGEAPFLPRMVAKQDMVALTSINKIALFSSNGNLLKEKRFTNAMIDNFRFLNGNYLILELKRTAEGTLKEYTLLNKDLNKIKPFYRHVAPNKNSGGKSVVELFPDSASMEADGNKMFFFNPVDDFSITVFDGNGAQLYKIQKKLPKVKIPQDVKDGYVKDFMKKFDQNRRKKIRKLFTFKFPVHYPDAKDLLISGDKLYLRTFIKKNGKCLYYRFDLRGKDFKKIYLPIAQQNLSCFMGNSFYYLKENEEREEWEFHRVALQAPAPCNAP